MNGNIESLSTKVESLQRQIIIPYVLDKEHGSWAEIHPVSSITKIP
jgi:hypothetical protein